MLQWLCENISKSMYGGDLSHDLTMLAVYEISEILILYTVVAYNILDWRAKEIDGGLEWNFTMGSTIFSMFFASKALGYCTTTWKEDLAHVSRMRYIRSQRGEWFR